MAKTVVTERRVIEASKKGKTMIVSKDAIITPSARDKAKELGITFLTQTSSAAASEVKNSSKPGSEVKIAIGSDHGGFAMKEHLKKLLTDIGYTVIDVGTNSTEAVDYPDFAHAVAKLVADGDCFRGIMIDGAGIGSCMVCNKVSGVRAAMCYDVTTALNSREHNDANVLTLGAKMIGDITAEHIVKVWIKTEFGGGRHQGRVDKIIQVEKQYIK